MTTAWNHLGTASVYDGGAGTDTITMVFSPAELVEILSNSTLRTGLQNYLDGTPTGASLDLSTSSWDARAQNFENASISLASDNQIVSTAVGNTLPPFKVGTSADPTGNTLVATAAGQTLTGGAGNDVLVATSGGNTLIGNGGANLLLGGSGNDLLQGGPGNDVMFGGAGTDTFKFAAGFGNDTITDFHPGEDIIEISKTIFQTFSDVMAHVTQDANHNTIITYDANDTIKLMNVAASTLHASDFHLS